MKRWIVLPILTCLALAACGPAPSRGAGSAATGSASNSLLPTIDSESMSNGWHLALATPPSDQVSSAVSQGTAESAALAEYPEAGQNGKLVYRSAVLAVVSSTRGTGTARLEWIFDVSRPGLNAGGGGCNSPSGSVCPTPNWDQLQTLLFVDGATGKVLLMETINPSIANGVAEVVKPLETPRVGN